MLGLQPNLQAEILSNTVWFFVKKPKHRKSTVFMKKAPTLYRYYILLSFMCIYIHTQSSLLQLHKVFRQVFSSAQRTGSLPAATFHPRSPVMPQLSSHLSLLSNSPTSHLMRASSQPKPAVRNKGLP